MTEKEFWSEIAKVDVAALHSGAEEGAVQPLIESLATLERGEMESFEDWLAQYLYALDGRVYADCAGESGKSGDGFLYARCFVVASGKDFYDAVLADPIQFPSSLDEWCESLLCVARRAWSEVPGKAEGDWDDFASVSYETGSNRDRWR